MNNLFAFIFSRIFWINVAVAIVVVVLLVFGTLQYLKGYSLHGETITVPDLKGIHYSELEAVLKERTLRYSIVDSVYSDGHKPGAVVNQNPEPETQVKQNRTIYLTVNAVLPPLVTVRDMAGLSRRQALSILEVMGLQIDSVSYKPDICLDCVLDVLYRGKTIKGGTKIKRGSKVTLILGAGKDGRVMLPDFYGMTFSEAKKVIETNLLTSGAVLACEGCKSSKDTLNAKVYKQIPPYFSGSRATITMGQPIDFFLTLDTLDMIPRELPGEDIEGESESESDFE
jgi:eukaryotic-like serine/threonine-protein kinase